MIILEMIIDGFLAGLFLYYIPNYPNTDIVEILLNLTGLILINQFTGIMTEVFEIFLHRYHPKINYDSNLLMFEHTE